MKYTIFSIDDEQDAATRVCFRLAFAMSDTRGNLIECWGSYKGKTENAFMCRSDDFDEFVWGLGWVDNQESVLRVSECNKQYAQLDYADFSNPVVDANNPVLSESIGSLKSVSKEEAMQHAAWTYRPDIDTYWIAVDGNPDTVPDSRTKDQRIEDFMKELGINGTNVVQHSKAYIRNMLHKHF